jgi:hypothetical protein
MKKIIYQAKARTASELVKPTIGTINVSGELKTTLTHKFDVTQELSVAYA